MKNTTTVIKGEEGFRNDIILSTERAESSYGIPVAIIEGEAYGPSEQTPDSLYINDALPWLNVGYGMRKTVLELAIAQGLRDDNLVEKFVTES